MRWLAGIITLVAFGLFLLPSLEAQDKKKADAKDVEAKKDDAKKDEAKKDDPKKDDEKPKKKEEKVVYGQTIKAKLKKIDANSARNFSIDVPQIDPNKVAQLKQWQAGEMNRIMRANPQQRGQQMAQFQQQMARKSNEIYSMREMDLRASDTCKVRALHPPLEYDDKGNLKVWTKKELAALKDESKLPGYPADFERLLPGQVVTVYLAKGAEKAKGGEKGKAGEPKKKKTDDNDDDALMNRPEVVMIVIEQEPGIPQR